MIKKERTTPFLRWAGSKKKQVPILSACWDPSYIRYVEPFMGSACLFFAINPERAILSDINSQLVKTFLAVRDHPRAVANRLAKLPLGKENYYLIRKHNISKLNDLDAASHFIYLNRFCFNGLYRTNLKGEFNVPYGTRTGKLPDFSDLQSVSEILRNSEIIASDFEAILESTRMGDFVYLDPPYAVANCRVFRQYGPASFGLEDLARLSKALISMDKRGVKFVLSYANSPEAVYYFKGWKTQVVSIRRNIAGFAASRKKDEELIFTNCRES